jgi:transcriptional regulator with XRE-family HTH domain
MQLRLARGMTQAQLGEAVGHDSTWVLRVESGRRELSWANAVRLAGVFDVDPRDIFVSPLNWAAWGTPDMFSEAAWDGPRR